MAGVLLAVVASPLVGSPSIRAKATNILAATGVPLTATTMPKETGQNDVPADSNPPNNQQTPDASQPETEAAEQEAAEASTQAEVSPEFMPRAASTNIATASRFATTPLYAYSEADPATAQAEAWRTTRPADAARMDVIAKAPKMRWLGDWNGDIYTSAARYHNAAKAANKTSQIVTYNIPIRHCDPNANHGAPSAAAYKAWIDDLARAVEIHPGIVVVEPDALGIIDCLSANKQQERYDLIRYASKTLAAAGAAVYIDASYWVDVDEMASRLRRAGVEYAAGFSINVANYVDTDSLKAYGNKLSRATGGKHFVIDTGRNGSGTNGEWCNAPGRSLGAQPQLFSSGLVDAYLWIKYPGESDGTCNGGPDPGQWWAEYALGLVTRAGY